MTAWEIMDATLKKSGMWDAQTNVDRGGQDCVADFETLHFINGFPNSIGKFRFKPGWARYGGRGAEMPELPDHFDVIDNPTPEKPFRLVAAPARTFLNSTFTETPGSLQREKRPTALLNKLDCERLGIAANDLVQLGNEKGAVLVHAQPKDGQQPGVRGGRGHLAQPQFREWRRHQPADQRRARLSQWRRGVPRHRRLAAQGLNRA